MLLVLTSLFPFFLLPFFLPTFLSFFLFLSYFLTFLWLQTVHHDGKKRVYLEKKCLCIYIIDRTTTLLLLKIHLNTGKWLFCLQISESVSSAILFKRAEGQLGQLARQKLNGERYEYDSGNDTSSPPSTQTSSSRSKGSQEASCQVHDGFGQAFSSEKVSSGSSSDSGNSFTSCFSRTKGASLEDQHSSPRARAKDQRWVIVGKKLIV